MTMTATYQVVGECAHATIDTPHGRAKVLLYKGALVPAEAPELKHLLSTGLVEQVGDDETGGVNADGITVVEAERKAESENPEADAAAKLAADREAARAKLPADGSMPDGRASQAVWVEYHVAQGGDYEELSRQDKPTLVELAKSRQS